MLNEYLTTGLQAGGITLAFIIVFVGFYWAFRGFPPASRLVISDPPVENDLRPDQATFMFFFVKWCPYSQDAMPKVESLRQIVSEFTYGGKDVVVKMINCDADKRECQKYKVDSYPDFKLLTAKKVYEYVGPDSVGVMREFLVSALGPEIKKHASS
jgi:hypothetical protein